MSANVSDGNREEFGKDLGLIQEAVLTGRRVGAEREFWSKLAHDRELFERVVLAVSGKAQITNYVVRDSGVEHFVPALGIPSSHLVRGRFVWNSENVYLSESNKDPLNINIYTLLKEKRYLVPENWIDREVIFGGTIFRRRDNKEKEFWVAARVHKSGFSSWFPVETDTNITSRQGPLFACARQ